MNSFHVNRCSRSFRGLISTAVIFLALIPASFASAYNGHPKLVVVIVIDQFRGDYLERYRDQFVEGGFRLFLDHGAYFTDCNYNYANTRTDRQSAGAPHEAVVTDRLAYTFGDTRCLLQRTPFE